MINNVIIHERQKLGFLADGFTFDRHAVESFLVDKIKIKVGAQEAWL
jgi:hypothetical protein